MQHCHFKTLSLRQLTLYYIEMRKEVVLSTFYSDGESIFKDVTDNYKKTYPHIKKGRATSHLRNRGIGAGQIIDRSKDYIYI